MPILKLSAKPSHAEKHAVLPKDNASIDTETETKRPQFGRLLPPEIRAMIYRERITGYPNFEDYCQGPPFVSYDPATNVMRALNIVKLRQITKGQAVLLEHHRMALTNFKIYEEYRAEAKRRSQIFTACVLYPKPTGTNETAEQGEAHEGSTRVTPPKISTADMGTATHLRIYIDAQTTLDKLEQQLTDFMPDMDLVRRRLRSLTSSDPQRSRYIYAELEQQLDQLFSRAMAAFSAPVLTCAGQSELKAVDIHVLGEWNSADSHIFHNKTRIQMTAPSGLRVDQMQTSFKLTYGAKVRLQFDDFELDQISADFGCSGFQIVLGHIIDKLFFTKRMVVFAMAALEARRRFAIGQPSNVP